MFGIITLFNLSKYNLAIKLDSYPCYKLKKKKKNYDIGEPSPFESKKNVFHIFVLFI